MIKPTISVSLYKCRNTYSIDVLALPRDGVPSFAYRIMCSSWKSLAEVLENELDYLGDEVGVVANYTSNKMPRCAYNIPTNRYVCIADFSSLPVECINEYLDYINAFERGDYLD